MRVPLTGGSYKARSIIASAQRCINLYGEKNPPQSPVPMTYYPTPGLTLLAQAPVVGAYRCLYAASNGQLYCVINKNVYSISPSFQYTQIGTISSTTSQVSMVDNGLALVLVDGTKTGYCADLKTNMFGRITDPNFLGANRADYIDTFFIFNEPGTQNFFSSNSNVTFQMMTTLSGALLAATIAPGSSYADGTYTSLALAGGSGTNATATIIVSGGMVTSVTIADGGQDYENGDVLTATIPVGSGFSYIVTNVSQQAFNPLYIAAKTGYSDDLISIIVIHHEIWLIGSLTSEIWYNAGGADFPFQIIAGVFVNHGCIAPYSVATQDIFGYWLGSDKQGQRIIYKGGLYQAKRISTHALEVEMAGYSTVSDAIGFTYQQNGHAFYFLTFPSVGKTWCWDESTEEWHERAATDPQGNLMRHWANCCTPAYDIIAVGDYMNGNLYKFDMNNYTDNSNPMIHIRGFPHLIGDNGERIFYDQFIADMEVGTDDGSIDSNYQDDPPMVSLRWSDDRGKTFGNQVTQSLGALGQYRTSMEWRRLGMARDRIFELEWSCPTKTALNGAFIQFRKGMT